MTGDDLLYNWARGEWHGPYPGPQNQHRCTSAEGLYQIPNNCVDAIDYRQPINWEHHKLVNEYINKLDLLRRQIVQFEYTKRFYFGDLKKHQRQEKASRKLNISIHAYKDEIKRIQTKVETLIKEHYEIR